MGTTESRPTEQMISFALVYGQSAITPRTFSGRPSADAMSTVAAPMEMPPSKMGIAPNRSAAQRVQRRTSYFSIAPKVIVCPALLIAQRVPRDARTAIVPGKKVDAGALGEYIAAPDKK